MRVTNSLIRERCGFGFDLMKRVERNVLKWLRHGERIGEERLIKNLYRTNGEGNEEIKSRKIK